MSHELQLFSAVREDYPDRYHKATLAEASISDDGAGTWVVRREPDADSHVCDLVSAYDEFWGRCTCKGYKHHDGPCSHLCALFRAHAVGLVKIPDAYGVEIVPSIIEDTRDEVSEPVAPAVADGGADDRDVRDAVGREVETDGGEIVPPAAGADGRVFGRPEGNL